MQKKKKIICFFLFLIILIAISLLFGKKIKNNFHLIFAPVEKSFYTTAENASLFFPCLLKAKQIEIENQELRSNNFNLLTEINKIQELKKENDILRSSLSLKQNQGFDLIMANVISKELDYLIVNRGSKDDIAIGMPVITANGVLVGKIKKVLKDFSFLSLISKKGDTFDVKIGESLGTAEGTGDTILLFQWVPKEEVIKQYSKVYTVNLGGKFPKGLLIGEVDQVEKNDAEAFQKGTIFPYFNLTSLETIFIIKNFNEITP